MSRADTHLATTSTAHNGPPPGATSTVIRGALRQARIELRVQLLSPWVLSWFIAPGIALLVLFFLRNMSVNGSAVSVAQLGVPGVLTMMLFTAGVLGVAGQLLTERDDGTLLRAKAVPRGITAHLLGNVLLMCGTSMAPIAVMLIPSVFLFEGVAPTTPGAWFTLLWVGLLGLFATLPLGAVVGALLRDAALLWIVAMLSYAALAISGVFYPLSALPGWLQPIGQALPTYWIGLGLRSALLPPEAVLLEAGGSWRPWATLFVLLAWSVVGFAVAVIALRRLARKQSGSHVTAARDRTLARGY